MSDMVYMALVIACAAAGRVVIQSLLDERDSRRTPDAGTEDTAAFPGPLDVDIPKR
jgi:hypothetical protein